MGGADCVVYNKCTLSQSSPTQTWGFNYYKPNRGTEEVPGCPGTAVTGFSYCFKPTHYSELTDVVADSTTRKLGECAGNCFSDNQCVGNLKCFMRDDRDADHGPDAYVPGCGTESEGTPGFVSGAA